MAIKKFESILKYLCRQFIFKQFFFTYWFESFFGKFSKQSLRRIVNSITLAKTNYNDIDSGVLTIRYSSE